MFMTIPPFGSSAAVLSLLAGYGSRQKVGD
jgi:hypothetical protein